MSIEAWKAARAARKDLRNAWAVNAERRHQSAVDNTTVNLNIVLRPRHLDIIAKMGVVSTVIIRQKSDLTDHPFKKTDATPGMMYGLLCEVKGRWKDVRGVFVALELQGQLDAATVVVMNGSGELQATWWAQLHPNIKPKEKVNGDSVHQDQQSAQEVKADESRVGRGSCLQEDASALGRDPEICADREWQETKPTSFI